MIPFCDTAVFSTQQPFDDFGVGVNGGGLATPSIRILVADDYRLWRRFVHSTLQEASGVELIGEASDGLEAVQKAQQLQPDLILLDIAMPKLNGIIAARQIREGSPKSKILFCSENLSPDIAEEALSTGASGYVVKSDAASDLLPAMTAVLQGKRFVSRRFAGHKFAETPDTHLFCERGHVVQFYSDDTVLLDGLAVLFRSSLTAGESVAVIMTNSHRSGLKDRLIAQGIDVSDATKNKRLVILDADQALSEFMDADGPSRERFLLNFSDLIRRAPAAAVANNKRVIVFGEMVAVLWAQKKYEAAIRLEELWNELALTCSFYLCCAYPASAFQERLIGGPYARICAQHSDVVSGFEALAPIPG
jgi:DNA-binding NarL/FixJ family response regulator